MKLGLAEHLPVADGLSLVAVLMPFPGDHPAQGCALEMPELTRQMLIDCRIFRLRHCCPVEAFRVLWVTTRRIWCSESCSVLLSDFPYTSCRLIWQFFKEICCFSFGLPLLFLYCSSPLCKMAGGVTVSFMLTALCLNSPQQFAEGRLTFSRFFPCFSFYSTLPDSRSPSLN